jgi:hypothetical protein
MKIGVNVSPSGTVILNYSKISIREPNSGDIHKRCHYIRGSKNQVL